MRLCYYAKKLQWLPHGGTSDSLHLETIAVLKYERVAKLVDVLARYCTKHAWCFCVRLGFAD